MAKEMKIYLFGGEPDDICSRLQMQLLHARNDSILNLFFHGVSNALRHEVALLSPRDRLNVPVFTTVDELNDRHDSNAPHVGVQNALVCMSEIADYIKYTGSLHGTDDENMKINVVGLSSGLLAAAAVALSPSIPALLPLGAHIVLIAFRLGLHVQIAANHLDSVHQVDDVKSWSRVIQMTTEMEVKKALDNFHRGMPIVQSNQAYVSACSKDSVTISGPPTTLKKLLDSSHIFESDTAELPIYGPYHAPHIHKNMNPGQILGVADPLISRFLNSYRLALPLMSATCFDPRRETTALLADIINEILNKPVRLQDIVTVCVGQLTTSNINACQIVPCGFTRSQSVLVLYLRSQTNAEITLLEVLWQKQSMLPDGISRTSRKPKLAIVGMAGRFPNAADHEKFWELLEAGLDVHRKIPKDRFEVDKHYDITGKTRNTSHTPFGCFIDEPGLFDPRFFNMSPREATQTDPMHRLGLASAYEALEMAGYVPNRTPSTRLDRIGTFYGQTSDDWREINAAQDVDTYFITGGVRAFAPGRINYYFKFTGPSFSVDTACSSSAAAMQLACTSLWAGDCDTAVAGGLNVMTNSDIFAGLSRGQFLSKTGNCQTYDNDADGYCRGDGIGTIILKRLDDAIADNDRILGVILETATNHSSNAISITHPHAPTQEILFKKVMDNAGVDPHDVSYVEMHGTGTQAGDGTEMRSVTNVFAPISRSGTRAKPLHLGSVKANVGHGEAVSGVTAMIKCLLMMQKNLIPPHCGIKTTINQGFPQDLNVRNIHIAFKPTPLVSRDGSPRRIFVNNFSAAGGNTATLLEDAPSRVSPRKDLRGNWVVAVSAKSKSALQANSRNLIQHIKTNRDLSLPSLSYTTTARRIQHNYRIAFSCDTLNKACDILASQLDAAMDPVQSVPPRVAFSFTGQGSHYTAIGNRLFELSRRFRADIIDFDNISLSLGFPSFLSLVKGDVEANDLPSLVVQLGLTCIQMALSRLWDSWGVKPDVVVGHSLGEYAALNAAGVISVSETIYLVGERAKLLQEKCTSGSHAMLATRLSTHMAIEALAETPGVQIACVNGARETVLGGTIHEINTLASKLATDGTTSTKLNSQFAFHSSQVDPILADFESLGKSVTFRKPQIPIISPLLASVLSEQDTVDERYLCRHARETVDFSGALASAQELGLINDQTVFVELGPHPICSAFIKSELGHNAVAVPTLRKGIDPYKSISESLSILHCAGLVIDWNEYQKDFLDCLQMVDLPAYAFDNKNYWIQYTGDWNLHKGQIAGLAALPAPGVPKLSTTTVQKIISEVIEVDKATMVIESEIARPDLLAAISGHVVNGTALCPSSIYGDMAITAGEYLYKLLRPETKTVHTNVCNMEVFKPFIANDNGGKGQILRLTIKADIAVGRATLFFSSGAVKTEVHHAKCHVDYGSGPAWLAEWQRSAYLINGRIDSLKKSASLGGAHRMLRGMAYKLFGAFVEYDQKYRGMEEVILDSPQLEATANVRFQTTDADGKFVCSPYWIDSVCHLAGFVVNANDAVDSSKQVYVSHGWESMRFAEPLVATKTYRSYVKMQPLPGNMVAGDVYILDGDKVVGMCGALKFQCIPSSLLNTFLPPKGSLAQKPPVLAAPRPALKAIGPEISKKTTPMAASIQVAEPSMTMTVLGIVAEEVSIPVTELADAIDFVSMGVDSLMSLSISGRVREELQINFQSSMFVDYPTVGLLKGWLSQFGLPESLDNSPDVTEDSATPSSSSDDGSTQYGSNETPLSPPGSPSTPSDRESLSMIIRQTISTEMGVEIEELLIADSLGAIGMDSLMALSILGLLREKACLVLPQDFLVEHQNIKAIEKALHISSPPPVMRPKLKPIYKAPASTTVPEASISNAKKQVLPERFASSVLLQGSPKSATKTLWLVPDGGGAPTSYVFLNEISPTLAVWGLTSPYVKTPEEYMCGVVGIATKFILEIKRRQPTGPYNLGGWSAGGVIAFEASRQLIALGHVVETLVFIDTPCPLIIEPLPSSLHRFFGSIGLLGEGDGALEKLPPWLLPHFAASVHALSTYDAKRIDSTRCPKVWAMWCEDGVCKNPEDARPDPYPYGHAQWLLENRDDFGPNLWDEFLDKEKMVTRHMRGNHFSMMKAPHVGQLVEFLREALL